MSRRKQWSPTDPRHFDGKSCSELQKALKRAEEFCEKYSEFQLGWHNEYRQELRRRIAEKIGARA